MSPTVAIGIDLGGTNLKAAAVDSSGRILAHRSASGGATHGPVAVVEAMVKLADDLLAEAGCPRSRCIGAGVGAPGPLSVREGRIFRCANLPEWIGVPLRDVLSGRLKLPVTLDNDGNAAAFGEFWAGAGRGCLHMAALTLGTGVGAGVIIDGKLLHGHFENAAELGHWIVEADGLPCPCGQRGCLEQYTSASAVARRVLAVIEQGGPSTLTGVVQRGDALDSIQVVEAAKAGDAVALRIWDDACRYLAIACVNIQHAFNPQRVLLAGGMSAAGAFLLDGVREHLSRQRWSLHEDVPDVALAVLGRDAGVVGAAGLMWSRVGRSDRS